jgi:D-amino-acid dehydrogenase
MHTLVIGSGVIGTTTAYYLARSGHQVTVVDRQAGAGLETSFANAGQISPGYSAPWAAPGIPLKAIKWLLSEYSPLVISPHIDGAMLGFMFNILRNCTAARYTINKSRMLRLAEYSRFALGELRADTGIQYDERTGGTLQLFRTRKQVRDAEKDIAVLQECGVPYQRLDIAQCVAAEPALARTAHKLAGGLRLPLDETGDCYKFTNNLARQCVELGVVFRFGITAHELTTHYGRVISLSTDAGSMQADNYVVALGSYSSPLLKPLGIDLPIYPVKGYSLTLPVTCDEAAPVSTVMDETHKVAITRLGERIRVAGTAELNGYSLSLKAQRYNTVKHVVRDLFPEGGNVEQAEPWTGLRPMTPDGTPVVGPTPYSNLYLNTGHGTLGWTMACGSGRLLADVINERQPEIELDGLTMQRYGRAYNLIGKSSAIPTSA